MTMPLTVDERIAAWNPPGCDHGRLCSPWKDSRCTLTDEDLAAVSEHVYRCCSHSTDHPDYKGPSYGPINIHLRDQVVSAMSLDEATQRLEAQVNQKSGSFRCYGGSWGPDGDLRFTNRGIEVVIRHTEFNEMYQLADGTWRGPECTFVEVLRAGFFSWREIAAWARQENAVRPWSWVEMPAVAAVEQPSLFEVLA